MTETIALFGGTGRTGRHVVTYALEKGYKIQLLARDPSKVETTHVNLTVIPGSFSDADALKKTIQGATYVISCAGGPNKPKDYPKDFMFDFVKLLYPLLEAETSVKVFLFQAGGFSPVPGKSLPLLTSFMRATIGTMIGIKPMLQDNDQVIKYLADNKKHFATIVTRPAMLEEKESSLVLTASQDKMSMSTITFKALAVFSVEAIKDESLYGTYPFPVPKK
jgi:hypothetical protein